MEQKDTKKDTDSQPARCELVGATGTGHGIVMQLEARVFQEGSKSAGSTETLTVTSMLFATSRAHMYPPLNVSLSWKS